MGLSLKKARELGLVPKDDPKAGKEPKYHTSPAADRTVDGIRFDSKSEARMYLALKAGMPEGFLHLQPEFMLQEGFRDRHGVWHRPVVYKADFLLSPVPRKDSAEPLGDGQWVLDTKGVRTEVFRIKRKLLARRYDPMHFHEVRNMKGLAEIMTEWSKHWQK
jgi:hypothetical protein